MSGWGRLKLYHGTDADSLGSICRNGIDLSFSRKIDTDFGPGFYLTTSLIQAQKWAGIISKSRKKAPACVGFELDRADFHRLKILLFTLEDCDPGYWAFVLHCRFDAIVDHQCGNGGFYDIVIGPVAKSWRQGRLTTWPGHDQYSFHTTEAVELLSTRCIGGVY